MYFTEYFIASNYLMAMATVGNVVIQHIPDPYNTHIAIRGHTTTEEPRKGRI